MKRYAFGFPERSPTGAGEWRRSNQNVDEWIQASGPTLQAAATGLHAISQLSYRASRQRIARPSIDNLAAQMQHPRFDRHPCYATRRNNCTYAEHHDAITK